MIADSNKKKLIRIVSIRIKKSIIRIKNSNIRIKIMQSFRINTVYILKMFLIYAVFYALN